MQPNHQIEIRSEESSEEKKAGKVYSVVSEEELADEISESIRDMIEEEKKKHAVSKSERKIEKWQSVLTFKKYYSVATVFAIKPTLQLPIHITRIFHSSKRYPNVPILEKDEKLLDKIYGAFFGFLIGDITGSFLAFTHDQLSTFLPSALLMNGGGTYSLGAGQGTDQTELLFTMAYALIEGKGEYNQNLMAKHYLEWIESKPFNFSTIYALSLRQLRKLKEEKKLEPNKMGRVLRENSLKNKNF